MTDYVNRERSLRGDKRGFADPSLLFYIGGGLAAFAAYVVAHRVFVYRPFKTKLDELKIRSEKETADAMERLEKMRMSTMKLQKRLDDEVERLRLYGSREGVA